jgi:hypothetical protein
MGRPSGSKTSIVTDDGWVPANRMVTAPRKGFAEADKDSGAGGAADTA